MRLSRIPYSHTATIKITQLEKGAYSHKNTLALDLVGLNNSKTIYSPCNGIVRVAINDNSKKGFGTYLSIADVDNGGIRIILGHLKYNSLKVKKGEKVKIGQVLGEEGMTGYATGSHLHMEIRGSLGIGQKSVCAYTSLPNKLGKYKVSDYLKEVANVILPCEKVNYKTLYVMKVRKGAGTAQKKVKDLTQDGKKNATSSKLTDLAFYKKGTIFTAQEIVTNKDGSIWAKTPSGYICLKDNKQTYCLKV